MFMGRKLLRFFLTLGLMIGLVGCNDPDERKTHYITIYVSQDVEIKEVLVDLDMKKPGVVVEHPEGVETKHRPTKPRKTVSFAPLPMGLLLFIAFLSLLTIRLSPALTNLVRQAERTTQQHLSVPLLRPA
jgi:glycerol uptake facilitator-like aquaporin